MNWVCSLQLWLQKGKLICTVDTIEISCSAAKISTTDQARNIQATH
jgi:hypothetical protein